MDFIFVSMPYARFCSTWFANVPNINLGIMQSYLTERGKSVKTFHFHLEFLPYLKSLDPRIMEMFLQLTEQFGVEYMGLDYIFASLLFEDDYAKAKGKFSERLNPVGLTLNDFEIAREVAKTFVDSCYSKLAPYLKKGAKLAGFSCSHYQLSGSLLLSTRIKKDFPEVATVFGGKDCAGDFALDLVKNVDCVDFVGTGECEATVDSLLEHIDNREKEFYNVVFRDSNGEVQKSASTPNVSMNSLPFPLYDFDEFPVEKRDLILPLEFGRGCPWKKCTFCPDEAYNIVCQTKTPRRIVSEIEHYQSQSADLRSFFIVDSDALKDPETVIEVSAAIRDKGLNFIFGEFRAEKMDREVLNAILRLGNWVSNFQIGIESFSERVLELMDKGVSALKNVEVLKGAAELGVPVQFNLFTCFPNMTEEDMRDNLRAMDLISHILVSENIQIFPGEFYLPPDCAAFTEAESFGLKRSETNIFSMAFEDFPMPCFSNYPYPYQFDNDQEQYHMAGALRAKVEEIKSGNSENHFMSFSDSEDGGLLIDIGRNGYQKRYALGPAEKAIYLAATESIRETDGLPEALGVSAEDVAAVLNALEQLGLVLVSPDKKSFLSLAMKARVVDRVVAQA